MNGLLEKHINLPGLVWKKVTPTPVPDKDLLPFTEAYDIFGDGTLTLVPTPGHTPGSLSLLLRADGFPPLLFVGDVTYDTRLLAAGRIPGVGKAAQLRETTSKVNEFRRRHPGLVVLAAHDPSASTALYRTLKSRAEA
jgi:N-acyl homoserine lactone hydrolase